jgi:hypothetical protein
VEVQFQLEFSVILDLRNANLPLQQIDQLVGGCLYSVCSREQLFIQVVTQRKRATYIQMNSVQSDGVPNRSESGTRYDSHP